MTERSIWRVLGLLLAAFSVSLLPPLAVSLWTGDDEWRPFLISFLIMGGCGLSIWFPLRRAVHPIRPRGGFVIVAFFWCGLSAISALPFMLGPHLTWVDALFETVSGFTTTGATALIGLDRLPPSILYYRQQLQWLGGMGVIVLAVAILPLLGIGGMQMVRAEVPGPVKDQRLVPRMANTARLLWLIYIGLTFSCALAYWVAGMSLFDAVGHSFATVSTGGFSTHDASLAHYDSLPIELIAQLFMLAGAVNFALHFMAWQRRSPAGYARDDELRSFLGVILGVTGVATLVLVLSGDQAGWLVALRRASFEVVSVITSTGFGIDDFSTWPTALPVMMIFISFIGGCSGSTAGGMKVLRVLLMVKQGFREIVLLGHPRAEVPVRYNGRMMDERTISSIWAFFSIYVVTFTVLMLAMMFAGLDQVTAFSAVATSINNLGPGLGEVATTFHGMSSSVKLIAVAGMLLGRLEIFSLLVLFSPAFRR